MATSDVVDAFRSLHLPGRPLLLPNPYDIGSARLLASMGFAALATTSGGFATTLGRLDGAVTRDEAVGHAAAIAAAIHLPVTADLENGFSDLPVDMRDTIAAALRAGLAGCSIEDYSRRQDRPIYERSFASDRIAAAAEAARSGPEELILTARAENYLHGNPDLDDTIGRLKAYEAAGADVLYAPGMVDLAAIGEVVAACTAPVNSLLLPGGPSIAELTEVGVSRISIGGALAYVALNAVAEAARDFQSGSAPFWPAARDGWATARTAFRP